LAKTHAPDLLPRTFSVWSVCGGWRDEAITLRRRTVEHVFGTLKYWMGATHLLTRGLEHVGAEMALHVLAYNFRRVINLLGMARTMGAVRMMSA